MSSITSISASVCASPPAPLSPSAPPGRSGDDAAAAFRGRLGSRSGSGFHAAPYRYRLHLAPSCPDSLRIAVTCRLLGLGETLPVTLLPPPGPQGHPSLGALYEATRHRYEGRLTAPVLCDGWSGRIVSNHAPDIERDLVRCFGRESAPDLRPASRAVDSDRFEALLDERPEEAFAEAEQRLAGRPYVMGETLTASDVHLWSVAPAQGARPLLDAHLRRLTDHPAFRVSRTVVV